MVMNETDRDQAYNLIDRFLRNNLDDQDYVEYSAALELCFTDESLHQQLADHIKRELMLLEFVQKIKKQTPEKPDYWSSCSQCEHNSNEGEDILEALAATADLDGLILCHAEPVRYIYEFKDYAGGTVLSSNLAYEGQVTIATIPLYRAWEPK